MLFRKDELRGITVRIIESDEYAECLIGPQRGRERGR